MQYRQQLDTAGNEAAIFTCDTHKYTDPGQAQGIHTTACTLFPCNCNPAVPVPTPAIK